MRPASSAEGLGVTRRVILASTSVYRAELLARLRVTFETRAPHIDEHIAESEAPGEAAARLARSKAASIDEPEALVIGSDQVPSLGGRILRKPGHHAAALEQLEACRGRSVLFYTAAAILDRRDGRSWETVDVTEVVFADLDRATLERYLAIEQPYDCAGGFKAEGLGIALFSAIHSHDPTALIGLPLIWVAAVLREAGLDPLTSSA
jgi:septum formation protein